MKKIRAQLVIFKILKELASKRWVGDFVSKSIFLDIIPYAQGIKMPIGP